MCSDFGDRAASAGSRRDFVRAPTVGASAGASTGVCTTEVASLCAVIGRERRRDAAAEDLAERLA